VRFFDAAQKLEGGPNETGIRRSEQNLPYLSASFFQQNAERFKTIPAADPQ